MSAFYIYVSGAPGFSTPPKDEENRGIKHAMITSSYPESTSPKIWFDNDQVSS